METSQHVWRTGSLQGRCSDGTCTLNLLRRGLHERTNLYHNARFRCLVVRRTPQHRADRVADGHGDAGDRRVGDSRCPRQA